MQFKLASWVFKQMGNTKIKAHKKQEKVHLNEVYTLGMKEVKEK